MIRIQVLRKPRGSVNSSPDERDPGYMIDIDELERLNICVSHMKVFHHIQNASTNVNDPEMRLQHCCYVQSVGQIPNYQIKASSKDFKSEDIEKYIEPAILYQNVIQLLQKHE